jgi:N-acetyl sugar amidotransferase
MREKETLVLLVADYPNPNGEPFLEDELKVISGQFKQIYLLQTNPSKDIVGTKMFLPPNATVVPLSNQESITKFDNIRYLFSLVLWYQLFLALVKHRVTLSLELIKTINYYLVVSMLKKEEIIKFIISENISNKTTVFYSYWCDVHAFALARLKKETEDFHFVSRVHGWDLYFERHKESFLPFREFIFKHADRVFPVSIDGRKYLMDKRLTAYPEKIITSYLGVSSLSLNPCYQVTEANQSKTFHLLSLSHINQIKRLDKIVDALSLLSDDIVLVWHHIGWGEPTFEATINARIEEKLSFKSNISVVFHGRFNKEQVRFFLQNTPIDVIINSSDTEGVPVSLMEAAAAGIPAIAFDVGGIPAVLKDQYNGILISAQCADPINALYNAIDLFLKMSYKQRKELSNYSLSIWKTKFDQQTNYNNFTAILKKSEHYKPTYSECSRCLVNNHVHPHIVFDKYGVCDICAIIDAKNHELANQIQQGYFDDLLRKIKRTGRNKPYDCLIGISGGVNSAYLAIKMKERGLNPLLVHVDIGWNSEIAVSNIESLVTKLGFDLYTVVIDWEEIQDVVKSFMLASVIDIDWANEMCFVSSLYKVANKFGIKAILTGHQLSSEGWMPENIVHYKLDLINFKAIHRKYGSKSLKSYPTIGYLKSFFYTKILGIHHYYPLDYIGYDKEIAKQELIATFGWRDYGQKHFESIFTRFYQAFILPNKFGIDKRIFHYSSLVTSGRLLREEAKEMLNNDDYFNTGQFLIDKEFIKKKLGFNELEFDTILNSPPESHFDYPSIFFISRKIKKLKKILLGL